MSKRAKVNSRDVAIKVAQEFRQLDSEAKDRFVEATLEVIADAIGNPKLKKKIFKKVLNPKRGLKPEAIGSLNQVITCFLWSLKPQWRYIWERILFRFLSMVPEAEAYAEQALKRHREFRKMGLKFYYFGVSKEGQDKMNKILKELEIKNLDDLMIL